MPDDELDRAQGPAMVLMEALTTRTGLHQDQVGLLNAPLLCAAVTACHNGVSEDDFAKAACEAYRYTRKHVTH